MKHIFCVVLLGCSSALPVTSTDQRILDAAETEWKELDLPTPGSSFRRIRIIEADQAEMLTVGYCASRGPVCGQFSSTQDPGFTDALIRAGCYNCADGSTRLSSSLMGTTEIRLSSYVDRARRCRTLAHEAFHALGWSVNIPDPNHSELPVWGEALSRVRALCN